MPDTGSDCKTHTVVAYSPINKDCLYGLAMVMAFCNYYQFSLREILLK